MSAEHYKKKIGRQTRRRLLKLLQENPKGLNTGDLRNKLKVSMPVLSTHLKALEAEKKIQEFRDPNTDRRFHWYRINPENEEVLIELSMHDAISFIKEMPRMTYYGLKPKEGKQGIAAFASVPATKPRQEWIEDWKKRIDRVEKWMPKLPGVEKGEKMAIVIMVEG
jgi:DNA-binding transcriptional ArsR family regulator